MLYPIHKNGNNLLYGGTVEKEVLFYRKHDKDLAMLKIKVSKDGFLQVIFTDDRILERLKKAQVKQGAYITVLVAEGNNPEVVLGLDFKFSGIWLFQTKDDKTVTVITGTASNGRSFGNDAFCVSIPVKNQENTDWYGINFYNPDEPEKPRIADFAKQYLSENKFCTIRCGSVREKSINGKIYRDLIGYKIFFPPKVS